jgi:hypothetical protein
MAYALVSDVATTLGRTISDATEIDQVNAWISDAELIIHARLGDLSALDAGVLRLVIKEAVARRVRNPDGKDNERIDDYSYGLVDDAKKVGISITDEEWAMLSPDGSASGAFMPTATPQWWTGGRPPHYPSQLEREGWS